ncbi:uncharacterized protein LOC134682021 [Mytilus trossulus]|uniref:uncharacterized protein LOC134682021 n=1 Tax=Mytilus trossulus TaxID=6551 RepID=UPI003004C99B
MDSTKVKEISVSITLFGLATLFLHKVLELWTRTETIGEKTDESHPDMVTDLKPSTDYELKIEHNGSDQDLRPLKEPSIFITTSTADTPEIEDEYVGINKRSVTAFHPSVSYQEGTFFNITTVVFGTSMTNVNTGDKTMFICGPNVKSTNAVIDGIINFIYGISPDDDFRFSVEQETTKNQIKDQGTDRKRAVTFLKVFQAEECRVPNTVNMICVPSNIEIEDIEKLSLDLDQNEMFESSLNSICFVFKDAFPLTCGQTLARYVNVFNTFVDDTNHVYDRKGRCPIPCLKDHSNVDCLNLSTCLRQIEVCQSRNSSFETVFEELKRSTTQPFEHALKVHLLQKKIERDVREFEIATENAIKYETKIETKIKDIQMWRNKKLLFDFKVKSQDKTSKQSLPSECRYDKYEHYFILQPEHVENGIKCLYCIPNHQICHKPCGLENQLKRTCKKFRCLSSHEHELTDQCNECKCAVDEHELGHFLSFANEIADFKKNYTKCKPSRRHY